MRLLISFFLGIPLLLLNVFWVKPCSYVILCSMVAPRHEGSSPGKLVGVGRSRVVKTEHLTWPSALCATFKS